jgi:hypothetical protein
MSSEKKTKEKKSKLGQFFTTNYTYILQNMFIPKGVGKIIEPFCGNGDLLNFIKNKEDKLLYDIECYDIDVVKGKEDFIKQRDTLLNPPDYTNSFILTNPPYLARNKTNEKEIYDTYGVNDLYKCFIKNLLTNKCLGGIIIIPLNFLSSIRKMDIELRREFLEIYEIIQINLFEEKVFEDTSYTVISMQFHARGASSVSSSTSASSVPITIYPSKKQITVSLNESNNYTIGGEIYNLSNDGVYTVNRLIKGGESNTNIVAKCIDDSKDSKIHLRMVDPEDIFIDETPNKSERSYATLVIEPALRKNEQTRLVSDFNTFLNQKREEYHSLFLSNYRESTSLARKRISFDLIYTIVKHLLSK